MKPTEDDLVRMKASRRCGKNYAWIARDMGISKTAVSYWLHKGIEKTPRKLGRTRLKRLLESAGLRKVYGEYLQFDLPIHLLEDREGTKAIFKNLFANTKATPGCIILHDSWGVSLLLDFPKTLTHHVACIILFEREFAWHPFLLNDLVDLGFENDIATDEDEDWVASLIEKYSEAPLE